MKDLATAISDAETAANSYKSAFAQTVTDQGVVDGINVKLAAAQTVVDSDKTNTLTQAEGYKQALIDLAASVQSEIDGLTNIS